MNYPIWEVPAAGLLIAAIAIVHVFISHFAVGGGLFLVVYEHLACRKGDTQLLEYVRRHSRFFLLVTLVAGALTGVGIWFTIGLVQPQATSTLIQVFVWIWAIEWTFFVTEIAAALVYYYGWSRLSPASHRRIGVVYFAAAWMSLFVINGILTFMLTPGDWPQTRGLASGFFNPTFWPALIVRTWISFGLAGLYALITASFLKDRQLRERIARVAAFGWTIPSLVFLIPSLDWYLRAAASAGVQVNALLASTRKGLPGVIESVASPLPPTGYPPAILAAFVGLVSLAALAILTLVLGWRPRLLRPVTAILLLALGIPALGAAEWIREDLRKPFVIARLVFVNGVRLPAVAFHDNDPFALPTLRDRGVLPSMHWTTFSPDLDRHLEGGHQVFRALCASCHTVDGYLGLAALVRGRDAEALDGIVRQMARPVDALGDPASWIDADVRVAGWRDRRMPPFAATDGERELLVEYLVHLAGPPSSPVDGAEISLGERIFRQRCIACHGSQAEWPMERLAPDRSASEFRWRIDILPRLNPIMPPFEGTEEEKEALATYLAERVGGGRSERLAPRLEEVEGLNRSRVPASRTGSTVTEQEKGPTTPSGVSGEAP